MAEVFNPTRLEIARKRRALSKGALATAAGITVRSLSYYERQQKQPDDATVARLASALRYPTSFFYGDDLELPPAEATSFRALTSMPARERDQAESAAALALALSDWIEDQFSLPTPSLPDLSGIDPSIAATAVRSEWGLGQRPIKNMVHLLEAHGVRVFSLTDDCQKMDAFSYWRGERPYVFLNTYKTAERGRMDAAHELGHLVLHSGKIGARGRQAEHEANLFGSSFLMPEGSIRAEVSYGAGMAEILRVKRRWKVAATNLTYRLAQLGMLSEWQSRSLFIELGNAGYRDDEPGGIARETSQVLAKVFSTLRAEGLSMSDVAARLNWPSDELSRIVFGLVVVSFEGTAERPSPPRGELHLVS